MVYPRQLNLGSEREEELKRYLDDELLKHLAERTSWLDDMIRYQKDYWAEPANKPAVRPWKGSAQIIIPLAAISTEAIHARTMTRMFGLPQITSVKAKKDFAADFSTKFEHFFNDVLKDIKFRDKVEDAIIEIEKFGTGIAKSGYERIVKHVVIDNGVTEEERDVVVKSGASIDTTASTRFVMPFSELDPQLAIWCGEQLVYTPYEFILQEESGLFLQGSFAKLKAFFDATSLDTENTFNENQENLEDRKPSLPQRLIIYEIWMAWDVDGSKMRKEIVLHYHKESRTLVSVRYNPYTDGRRPYRIGRYIKVEHRWSGIGICKQVEQFQREVTAQHRMRLDNAALANMRMIKVSKMSGYGPDEEIFPGKMWFLNDMTHMDTFQLGEIYPSSFNDESLTLSYAHQRTGVNEVTLGMPSSGTPDTATSALTRVQEGNKKFDYTYANIKSFANELITDIACNVQQFGARRVEYLSMDADGQAVMQLLDMPDEFLRDSVIFDVGIAGEQENQLVDRQNWTQVAGMMQQYYTGALQLAQLLGDPQIMAMIAQQGLVASTEAMRQILESFNARNIDRMILSQLLKGGMNGQQIAQPAPPIGNQGVGGNIAGQGLGITPAISG